MTLSLNEVEVLTKKAARGAGYPWGLAEEAGKATRWLHQFGLDGCAALAGLLGDVDGSDLMDWAPVTGAHWSAGGGTLCPIATGAALSDRAGDLAGSDLQFGPTAHPLLLAPFAAWSAKAADHTVSLKWQDCTVVTDGEAVSISGTPNAARGEVTVATGAPLGTLLARSSRAAPTPEAVAKLTEIAGRTYAPATEESRMRGAGSGLSDND